MYQSYKTKLDMPLEKFDVLFQVFKANYYTFKKNKQTIVALLLNGPRMGMSLNWRNLAQIVHKWVWFG